MGSVARGPCAEWNTVQEFVDGSLVGGDGREIEDGDEVRSMNGDCLFISCLFQVLL